MGIHVEGLGQEPGGGLGFLFSPFDPVFVGADLGWGGYDTGAQVAQSLGFFVGGRFSPGGVSVCPALLWRGARFDFEDRFGAERGQVAEAHAIVSVEAAGLVGSLAGVSAGWRFTPSVVSRWRTTGRRWIAANRVPPEVITENEKVRETLLEAGVGLTFMRGDVGWVGGVASRSKFDRELSYFLEVVWTLPRKRP